MKIWRSILLVLLFTPLWLSACKPVTKTPEITQLGPSEIVKGGKVVVGTPQEPKILSPLLSTSIIEVAVSSFIIEGLIQVDADGNYAPVLAESLPTVSSDGLVVTYKIKKNVKFSNGDVLNCADVKFTLDAILSKLSQMSTLGYKNITKLECPDDYTAVATFNHIYAPYLSLFSFIIPRSAGDITKLDTWDYNRKPVGTGPWILQDWKSGDTITLVKNTNYRVPGKPYLDSIIIKILPSHDVGLQLLGTGEIQVLWNLIESDFPALDKLKSQEVSYAAANAGKSEILVLNFADPSMDAPADATANPHPILGDLRVRQALQMAINKKEIVDTLLYGGVKVGTTVLSVGVYACPQEPSLYNLEEAQKLLDEAGWKPGTDGIREKDGNRLSLKINSTSGNQLREQTEQVLVEMLKKAGIELTIENMPSDVLLAGWSANGLRKHGKFDILLYTTGPAGDPDYHLYDNYHSSRIPTQENQGAGNNFSRYKNADVDQWIDSAAGLVDIAARRDLFCKVAAQINKDIPRIFLYERLQMSGYRTNLQNFKVSPGMSDFSINSEDWWLKP